MEVVQTAKYYLYDNIHREMIMQDKVFQRFTDYDKKYTNILVWHWKFV